MKPESGSLENIGTPPVSPSRMICSRLLRVRSSPLLASSTLKDSNFSTRSLTSPKVIYALVLVSYKRRLGYFLIRRTGSDMLQASGFLCAAQHYSRKAKYFRLKVDRRLLLVSESTPNSPGR